MFWRRWRKRLTMRELVIRRISDIRLDLLAKHQDVALDTDIGDLHLLTDVQLLFSLGMWERTKHSSDLMIAAMQHRTRNIEDVIGIVNKADIPKDSYPKIKS